MSVKRLNKIIKNMVDLEYIKKMKEEEKEIIELKEKYGFDGIPVEKNQEEIRRCNVILKEYGELQ